MKKIFNSIVEKNTEYSVIDLRKEYPDLLGEYRFAIATQLSDEELKLCLGTEIDKYQPYIVTSLEYLAFLKDEYAKERSEEYFRTTYGDSYSFEEGIGFEHNKGLVCDFEAEMIRKEVIEKKNNEIHKAVLSLKSERMRKRIINYYWKSKTELQIAQEEQTNQSSVHESLKRGIKNLKKFLEKPNN